MRLSPPGLPWLQKPAAVIAAGSLIVDSVLAAQGLAGYFDLAEPLSARWIPPRRPIDAGLIRDRELARPTGGAAPDNVSIGVRHLVRMHADIPPGTFVFVLSDFLQPPAPTVWALAAGLGQWPIGDPLATGADHLDRHACGIEPMRGGEPRAHLVGLGEREL